FVTSIYFAGAATLICLVVSFPIAYWIAFYGGNKKNFFLLMLLVPFFVSFVIRTIVWQFILSDNGIVLGTLKNAHPRRTSISSPPGTQLWPGSPTTTCRLPRCRCTWRSSASTR